MEKSSVMTHNYSPTLSSVPREVLEKILHWVPTKDLLFCCRLVSKLWTEFSTPICRSRYVRLHFKFLEDEILPYQEDESTLDSKSLYSIFESADSLPWSSCTLRQRPYDPEEDGPPVPEHELTTKEIRKFIRVFGADIRKIELGGYDSIITMEVISAIPNVEEVDIFEGLDEYGIYDIEWATAPVGRNISLHRLRRICYFEIYKEEELNFLETLVTGAAAPLDYVSLDFAMLHQRADEIFEGYAHLLKGVVSIYMEFFSSFRVTARILSVCASNKLCISKLDVNFYGVNPNERTEAIQLFAEALQHLSTHLKKLSYSVRVSPEFTALVRLPDLPVLKQLKLGQYGFSPVETQCLYPFTTNQFPVLERIKIVHSNDLRPLFESAVFNSVTQLIHKGIVDESFMRPVDWNRTLPNLKNLHGCKVDGRDLEYIFAHMTHLVHLSVKVDMNGGDGDLNAILSGIFDPDRVYHEWDAQQISEYRATHSRPALLAMTCLRTLGISISGLSARIRDSGAYLSLLQIQPLDSLDLGCSCNISSECETKLRAYHRGFKILN